MELRLSLTGPAGELDVVLAAPDQAPVDTVAGALADAVGAAPDAALTVAGQRLDRSHPVGVAPLLNGARIGVGMVTQAVARPGPRQLRVVGGPDAGAVRT
ncbi:MAG TPA: hypothetical protein VGR21_07375, partial [Cryptosporangiaceae bacterium]|nr:hypothetical protein [Cryptosporangiaceae bacterium]